MAKEEIVGMKEVEKAFKELGKVPQTVATKSARAGATIAFRSAKKNAPENKGDLKRGIIMKRERRKIKGKAVYDVLMSPHMNDVFVKISKSGKRSYYPASQEYGFLTVDGKYIPGYRYFERAITENSREIEKKILSTTKKEVEKALTKR